MTSEARQPSSPDGPTFRAPISGRFDQDNRVSREISPVLEIWQDEMTTDLLGLNAWLVNRKQFIIDQFLADDLPAVTPISQEDAMPKLKSHLQRIADEGLENLPWEFKKYNARLRGVVSYLEEKDRVAKGEPKGNWFKLFNEIMDFEPVLVPEDGLEETRAELIECLEKVGRHIQSDDDEGIRQAMLDYHEDTIIKSKAGIERTYWRYARRYRAQFLHTIGRTDLMDVDYSIRWKEEDEFYKMYEKLDKGPWHLDANWDVRHRDEYDQGLVEQYSTHEDHHFLQGEAIKRRIKDEELHPLLGLVPQPGPDNYQMEGLALTVSLLSRYSLSPDAKLGVVYYRLQKRAMANGMYRVESGEDINEVATSLARYMPLRTPDEIKSLLEEATTKTFDRFYQPVYGMAEYELSQAAKNLSPEKRLLFLRKVYSQVMNRQEIHKALTDAIVA